MDKIPRFHGTVAVQGQDVIFDSASGTIDQVKLADRLATLNQDANAVDVDKSDDSVASPKKE